LSLGRVRPGATVVIVNWNSVDFLTVTLDAVERYSSPDTSDILVVDNDSHDGSRDHLATRRRVRTIRLPRNVGHPVALDIGVLLSRREFFITLDVDAFPIEQDWIDRLLAPLSLGSADVSGVHVRNGFIHPCCLAMRLDRFVRQGHTFQSRYGSRGQLASSVDDTSAGNWDVGWLISMREPRRFLFERTRCTGPGDIGSVWKGLIYHNFYSTRFGSTVAPTDEELEVGVSRSAALAAWDQAVLRYLAQSPPA
jgi:glycosyltransferase involved in cell wall biosynthesis